MNLPYKILIGTHHKSGTVWMDSIFRRICQEYSLIYYSGSQDEVPKKFDVFFQDHSKFTKDDLPAFRGIHLIRDPRDIIISACFYHGKSSEPWLHQPRRKFNGLTYQEKINMYRSVDDQLLFEMENSSFNTINDISDWDYDCPSFMEHRYETLVDDLNLVHFKDMLAFLGFPTSQFSILCSIIESNSLFSSRFVATEHVRSGRKVQWPGYFKAKHKERFISLFGNVLINLGYEQDDNWQVKNSLQD